MSKRYSVYDIPYEDVDAGRTEHTYRSKKERKRIRLQKHKGKLRRKGENKNYQD